MTTAAAIKERPILFSAPMIRAILAGRKSQTRRVVKPQPKGKDARICKEAYGWEFTNERHERGAGIPCGLTAGDMYYEELSFRCPYGQPGERLWVREKLELDEEGWCYGVDGEPLRSDADTALDWMESRPAKQSVCVSIHMPRWASRITLEVTGVRVERVQDITEADAKAEGIQFWDQGPLAHRYGLPEWTPDERTSTAREAFMHLFYGINKRANPNENPWVWVVSFKRIEGGK